MARLGDKFRERAAALEKGSEEKGTTRLGILTPHKSHDTLTEIPIYQIEPDPNQPRRYLGDLTELKASIVAVGLVQPITVCIISYERYRIIAGERRFQAAKELNLARVPAIVRTIEENQRLQIQIVENLHRKDLTPVEEAMSYQQLMNECGLTQEQVAERVGKSRPAINEILRILDLAPNILEECRTSDITKSLLLEISKRPVNEQYILWDQAKAGQLTVREVRRAKNPEQKRKPGSSVPMTFRYPIATAEAIVTVTFERPKATSEEIIAALEEALSAESEKIIPNHFIEAT